MKLLLDQGIPVDCVPLFRALGHTCHHVSAVGMQRAKDRLILAKAKEDDYVLVTLDSDFHALVATERLDGPSVVRLRREGCNAELVVEILQPALFRYQGSLAEGCLISVTESRATCGMLPILD